VATFAARVLLAGDNTLTPRMQIAVILTALAVAAEPRPGPDATQDARTRSNVRRAFARDVLRDPVAAIPRVRWVLACTDLADVTAPTDDDILTRVASVWDALAGA
jgi:hypothetical protein